MTEAPPPAPTHVPTEVATDAKPLGSQDENACRVLSVNMAKAVPTTIQGRSVLTAIGKQPVSSLDQPTRIAVHALGLEGDEQADLSVHGGLGKAVYAYPRTHYPFWQTVRAQASVQGWQDEMPNGMLGENLTLTGLLEADAHIGDVLRFPDCTFAISEPRFPCFKLEARLGFKHAIKMMAQSGFCGYYLAVRTPGTIAAGDTFELLPGPREVSIRELFMAKMRKEA